MWVHVNFREKCLIKWTLSCAFKLLSEKAHPLHQACCTRNSSVLPQSWVDPLTTEVFSTNLRANNLFLLLSIYDLYNCRVALPCHQFQPTFCQDCYQMEWYNYQSFLGHLYSILSLICIILWAFIFLTLPLVNNINLLHKERIVFKVFSRS